MPEKETLTTCNLTLKDLQLLLRIRQADKLVATRQTCPECKQTYKQTRKWQRFCSETCRLLHHQFADKRLIAELEKENTMLLEEIVRLRGLLEVVRP